MVSSNKKKLWKILLLLLFVVIVIVFVFIGFSEKYFSKEEKHKVISAITNKLKFEIKAHQYSKIDTSDNEYVSLIYANQKNTIETYSEFLNKFPNSQYYNLVLSKMIILESEFSVRKIDSIFVNSEDELDPFSGFKGNFLYFTDKRDNQTYKVIKIGDDYWFAENLKFKPDSCGFCAYNRNDSLVGKYGFLYDWTLANSVCPKGWHLPTDEDWKSLEQYCGGSISAGYTLKSKAGWYKYNSGGQNNLGFSAIAAGLKSEKGDFQNIKKIGAWWSSSSVNETNAWYRNLSYDNNSMYRYYLNKNSALSVRCVK